jgi:hypothetical protein
MEYGIFSGQEEKRGAGEKTSRSEVRQIIPFFGKVFSSFPVWHYCPNPDIFLS